jgi:uncharacterized membrane protein YozB (DUF420 family)
MARFIHHPADRRFFGTMAFVAAAVILVGFGNTYGPKVVHGTPALPWVVHLHAAVFGCWLVLLVVQVGLVARKKLDTHRRLGAWGVALAALMLVVGLATAIEAARLGHRGIPGVEFPGAAGFLLLNVVSLFVFGALAAAGWAWRHRPQAHKRLMLSATVAGLMPPAIARLPGIAGNEKAIGPAVLLFLVAGPAYDLATRRRVHPAYGGLALALLAVPPVVLALSSTAAWAALAAWVSG